MTRAQEDSPCETHPSVLYPKLFRSLAHADLLIPDDFGTAPLTDQHRRDLIELTEDRYGLRATLIAAEFPQTH